MRHRLLWTGSLLCLLHACTQPLPVDPVDHDPETEMRAACAQLVQAAPHQWGPLLQQIHGYGSAAERHLIEELQRHPTAAGAQASIALLGRIGADSTRAFCEEQVQERTPLACEAALALGELAPGSREQLLACVRDKFYGVDVRTAAACALLRHGERDVAPSFVTAIVRAGTSQGRTDEQLLGIPNKARWALERYFVKRTLLQLGHRDLADELDPDAPWPRLEKLAPRVGERLRGN